MAAPAALPCRKEFARHPHGGLEVDPQRAADLLLGKAVQAAGRGQAGVRDQDVEVAGFLQQAKRGPLLGEVGDDRPMPLAGQAGHEAVQLLRLARAQDEPRAALGERERHRPPEASGGAGQENRFPVEPHASNLPTASALLADPPIRRYPAIAHRLRPVKLYVCWGTFQTPRPGGHPCHNAYAALRMAGHDPEVIKVRGLGVGPRFMHLMTSGRREVEELSGQREVPVLVADDGEVVTDSRKIVEWAEAHPA